MSIDLEEQYVGELPHLAAAQAAVVMCSTNRVATCHCPAIHHDLVAIYGQRHEADSLMLLCAFIEESLGLLQADGFKNFFHVTSSVYSNV